MVDSLASSSSTLVGAQKSLQFGRRRASKQLRTGFSFSRPRNIFFQATCQSQLNFFCWGQEKDFCLFSDRHLWPGKRLLYLQNFALCVLP